AHALFGNRTKQGLDPRLHFVHGGVVAEIRQRAAKLEARDVASIGTHHDPVGRRQCSREKVAYGKQGEDSRRDKRAVVLRGGSWHQSSSSDRYSAGNSSSCSQAAYARGFVYHAIRSFI